MIKRIIKQIETPTELISQIIKQLGGGDGGGGDGGTSQQYIDGEVEYHQDLPTGIGNPATNTAYLVRKGQGVWLINRKPAGIWVRETDIGNLNDWVYAGSFPDVYNDANFRIYDNDDSSKNLAFNLNDLNTNTTVTLTIPQTGGTVITSNDTGVFYVSNNPSGFITGIENIVYTTGDQTISGLKDFVTRPTVNGTGVLLSGEAASLPDTIVYTSGDQTISGLKDFNTRPTVNTVPVLLSGEVNTTISGVFYTAEVNIKNNNGSTIYKGQPVYVSSAAGPHILVKLASNTGESTSSKTFGLVNQSSLNQNTQGTVVTEGLLHGFNTSAAGNEGDPIWLGPTGNLIFGLTNKPQAPNHLVYLGVVTRKHATQGEIFVHIQNGFEVRELHDARIINEQNSDILIYNSSSGLWLNSGVNFDNFYTNNNPSGYITGVDTSSLYPRSNPSGYITGVDLSSLYPRSNPSGFVTGVTNHAASHVAGTKAQLIVRGVETGGIDTTVFFRADNAGTAGNSITLTFDGVDDIDTVVGAWNSANPSNTVSTAGDVSQVPGNGTSLQLADGVNGGSDSLNQINQNLNTADDVTFNTFNTETFAEGSFTQIGNFYAPANQTEGNNTFFRIGTEDNENKAAQIGYRAGGDTFGRNGFICLDFYGMDYLFQLSHDGGKPELWTSSNPVKLLTFGDGAGGGYIVSELPVIANNLVYNTGNQTISGTKTFATRPQVNGTGVLLNGEAYGLNNPSGFITGVNLSNYVTNTNLQKLQVQLSTGIEIYTGTFNTAFNSIPTVVATIEATGLFNYVTTLVNVTTTGFVTDFSDIIGESGVMLNIIAYN